MSIARQAYVIKACVNVLLVRAGTTKLRNYFSATTRPAATMSLIEKLNDPGFFEACIPALQNTVRMASPGHRIMITDLTPLGMLEDMTKGRVE